jgi:hypothetical protein
MRYSVGSGLGPRCNSRYTHTCCDMAAAMPWRMPATTDGRYRLGSATSTFSTPCATPSLRRTGSKSSGAIRQPFALYDALFPGRTASWNCSPGAPMGAEARPKLRFQNISGLPQGLPALPVHPEPAVSWHSGFRGGAHARPKATPVHHADRRRGGGHHGGELSIR